MGGGFLIDGIVNRGTIVYVILLGRFLYTVKRDCCPKSVFRYQTDGNKYPNGATRRVKFCMYLDQCGPNGGPRAITGPRPPVTRPRNYLLICY
jgi:hypothetical protein